MLFTPHARDKIARLDHLKISESTVISIVLEPEKVESGYLNRKIAQRVLSRNLVLRVVFEEMNNTLLVITVYPATGRRYRVED